MARFVTGACWSLVFAGVALSAGAVSAGTVKAGGKAVADEWCGFAITVGEPWQRAPFRTFAVPGAIRCAWSGPKDASVVIFLQEPESAVNPRTILDASVAAQKDKLNATVNTQELRPVAGMQAMWLVITGKGTGGAIDGKGEVETTQHWVVVPRERDVVVILLTCRQGEYAGLQKSFEALIGSLKLSGSQTAEQKAAK